MLHKEFLVCLLATILVISIEKVTAKNNPAVQIFPRNIARDGHRSRRADSPDEIAAYVEDLLGEEDKGENGEDDLNECGRVDVPATALITEGEQTERGKWPWHAAIYRYDNGVHSYRCGGTLIGRKAVITAAHCVRSGSGDALDPESLIVYLGKHNLRFWRDVQEMKVEEVVLHPDFSAAESTADIAILILSTSARYNTYTRPVCLWNEKLIVGKGIPGTVIGWGFDSSGKVTGDLMLAKMPIVTAITCVKSFPEFFGRLLDEKKFCAGFRNGTSVCNGDSGGGMVFPLSQASNRLQRWYLRGVVSLGPSYKDTKVCDPYHYVLFTDVVKFLDWIKKYIT